MMSLRPTLNEAQTTYIACVESRRLMKREVRHMKREVDSKISLRQ